MSGSPARQHVSQNKALQEVFNHAGGRETDSQKWTGALKVMNKSTSLTSTKWGENDSKSYHM